ncbi:thioesterase II family protein [Streptomyces noursei]|uniref:thioesterase II family protein n=1 Tax=Streptomyces noursei TaxID=1971 RepID=UPI001E33AF96|nr:alpha/beta fold hydrolase [Streptomyces noursei]MCZ1013268.1 alpha/beta fold hydrolase [Streptomyces noursei]
MRNLVEERWLRRFRDDVGCRTKLVCFPHAGGGASAYRTWAERLPADVGVLAVRYPGREDRLGDPFSPRLEVLADDIAEALEGLTQHPLVLFGHSMGASVAHEVALRFQERGRPPVALCVSGRRPPHGLGGQREPLDTDEEIIADVVGFDESRAEVFADPGLRELLLPAVRADYRLVDEYLGGRKPLLGCPVFGYTGDDDPEVTSEQMQGWADMTRDDFRLRVLPGGHFYLREEEAALLADMRGVLARFGRRTSS